MLSEKEIQERLYGKFRANDKSDGKDKPTEEGSQQVQKKRNVSTNLFGQEIVDDLKTALVSKAVLEDPLSAAQSKAAKSKLTPFATAKREPEKSKRKILKTSTQDTTSLRTGDPLGAEDKPNFRLEWEEWRGRFRRFSIWHVLFAFTILLAFLVLFNVLVRLSVEKGDSQPLDSSNAAGVSEKSSSSFSKRTRQRVSIQPLGLTEEKTLPASAAVSSSERSVLEAGGFQTESNKTASAPVEVSAAVVSQAKQQVTSAVRNPFHTIQICIYENEPDAERLAGQLAAQGYKDVAYEGVKKTTGRQLFQVYYGKFSSFAEAQKAMEFFRRDALFKRFPDSFVRQVK